MDEAPERINAAALLLARGVPIQPALAAGGRSIPYDQLRRAVARAATLWLQHGLAPGELVLLRGDHGPEHVIAFLAAIWAGAVPVPLRSEAPQAGIHFARNATWDARVLPAVEAEAAWSAWQPALEGLAPTPPLPCLPWAPACWTEPRTAGAACLLPHHFALALMARPGLLPLARTSSMLGVLRALRRGVTAVLEPRSTPAPEAVPA
jgi:non-ribosomal peptide synthetase component F